MSSFIWQGSTAWPSFIEAVARKDWAVGYMILMSLGQSTMVLSALLAKLTSSVGQSPRELRTEVRPIPSPHTLSTYYAGSPSQPFANGC